MFVEFDPVKRAGWVQGGVAMNEKAAGLARAGSDRRTFVRAIPSSIWCRDRSFASVRQAYRA